MNSKAFVVLGILFISAIFVLVTSKNSSLDQEFLQTPTPTSMPINIQTNNILGEKAREEDKIQDQEKIQVSKAIIVTSKGEIEITLFPDAAPNTVANFANKSQNGFYNSLTFHRVEDWVVQGGDPLGNGTGGGQMPTELNNNPFIRGSVGVARRGNIEVSNDSQFFITKTGAPHLDQQYTNFGQVSEEGLKVVDSLTIGDTIKSIIIK